MANPLVEELVGAGVHFGHRVSRWNPRMAPYIYGKKNQIHIIDVRETVRGLLRAKKYLSQVAEAGSLILFVGTKRQASDAIEQQALRCGMPYVCERWLGGALTTFRTILEIHAGVLGFLAHLKLILLEKMELTPKNMILI